MAIKIDPATVTIERAPPYERPGREPYFERGQKIIKVAGDPYGLIHQHQHGGSGNGYTFQQIGGQTLQRKISEQTKFHAARFTDVKVWGDKMEARGKGPGATVKPVAERLHAQAVELIHAGKLISAKAQAEIVEQRRQMVREREDRHAAEKKENFKARAEMAIDAAAKKFHGFNMIGDLAREGLAQEIAKAMEWAQSQ